MLLGTEENLTRLLSALATARARQRMGKYRPQDRPISQKRRGLLGGVALAALSTAFTMTLPPLLGLSKPPYLGGPRRAEAFTDGLSNKVNLTINVNDFYPGGRGGPTGRTNPLSNQFGSNLAAAQAVYPFATALTDETDWCAWMAAALALYNANGQRAIPPYNNKYAAGTLRASGCYVVNRTITLNLAGIHVQGDGSVSGTGQQTSVTWTRGAAGGSASAPVYILDCHTYDEGSGTVAAGNFVAPRPHTQLGATLPPGPNAVQPFIENIAFIGQEGDMKANSPSVSNYISGLRVRNAQFTHILGCTFAGTLYDGIVFTAGQLFCRVSKCEFSGVHRDAVAVRRGFGSNYATTTTIEWCEFYDVGRYDILYDTWSGIATTPRIINNSFESRYNSYWVQNPQFWVQGVVAPVCLIGASSGTFSMNYTEGIIDATNWPNVVATLHLCACGYISCRDNNFANVFLTTYPRTVAPRTRALINFANANHYSDITDQQNYNIGTARDYNGSALCSNISFANCADLNKIYVGSDGLGLTNVAGSSIYLEQSGASFYTWPTTTMIFKIRPHARCRTAQLRQRKCRRPPITASRRSVRRCPMSRARSARRHAAVNLIMAPGAMRFGHGRLRTIFTRLASWAN